jgi:hypothetical protein
MTNAETLNRGLLKAAPMVPQIVVAAAVLALLSACDPQPNPPETAEPPPVKVVQSEQSPLDPTARMRFAEGSDQPDLRVQVKYSLPSNLEPRKPAEVRIAFIPVAGVDAITVKMTPTPDLQVEGQMEPQFNNMQAGQPYEHRLTVQTRRRGTQRITIDVQPGTTNSPPHSFAIPLEFGAAKGVGRSGAGT